MLDITTTTIDKVSIHHVGNKNNEEPLLVSKRELQLVDQRLDELLKRYFLHQFKTEEFYSFTFSNNDFTLNPLFQFAEKIFNNLNDFHSVSRDIAQHLYEVSNHPQIKEGDLFVVHFTDLVVVDEVVNCIGIFKSENRHTFLKLNVSDGQFLLDYEDGINIDKLDKGCLIYNTDKEIGYKVSIIDNTSKAAEAQFWCDSFLTLRAFDDNYYKTKSFLAMAKDFVVKELPTESEVSKTEQIKMMNRSIEYFKNKDTFNREEFEDVVFQDKSVIHSFREYDAALRQSRDVDFIDDFEISSKAVRRQEKMYKTVLKLDNNFHIYIHRETDMLEHGTAPDGRKYYKLYYHEES
ncbi:MAG: nucleoid-associated protein [Ignavibacteria bacterium]|nr:nucleoid-associated protein [Ignavibacteria bacterium]